MNSLTSYTVAFMAFGTAIASLAFFARCWSLGVGWLAALVVNSQVLIVRLCTGWGLPRPDLPAWVAEVNNVLNWASLVLTSAGVIQLLVRYRKLKQKVESRAAVDESGG